MWGRGWGKLIINGIKEKELKKHQNISIVHENRLILFKAVMKDHFSCRFLALDLTVVN